MQFQSIKKYDELLKSRPDPNRWHDNICEAELYIESEQERKHFTHYILNPAMYDPEQVKNSVTHGELYDDNKLFDERKALPGHMKEERFENGTETFVIVKNISDEEDDEKNEKLLSL